MALSWIDIGGAERFPCQDLFKGLANLFLAVKMALCHHFLSQLESLASLPTLLTIQSTQTTHHAPSTGLQVQASPVDVEVVIVHIFVTMNVQFTIKLMQ
jgi:hypothetical protein